MAAQSARKTWLDQARGIGILLVVLGHIDPQSRWMYSFHVPLFFVLSGILTAMRNAYASKPLRDVISSKAKRLLYPYLTFSLLVLLYYALRGRADRVTEVIWITASFEGYDALWFLPALFIAECMMLVLLRSKIPHLPAVLLIMLGTSTYAALQDYAIGGAMPAQEGLLFLILNALCRAGIGFCFMISGYWGYRLHGRMNRIPRSRQLLLSLVALALGFFLGLFNGKPDLHYSVQGNPVLYYLSAWLQSFGVIALCILSERRFSSLAFWGKHSLVIMATHSPVPVIYLSHWLLRYAETGIRCIDDLLCLAVTMLIEWLIILFIGRYASFMIHPPKAKNVQ